MKKKPKPKLPKYEDVMSDDHIRAALKSLAAEPEPPPSLTLGDAKKYIQLETRLLIGSWNFIGGCIPEAVRLLELSPSGTYVLVQSDGYKHIPANWRRRDGITVIEILGESGAPAWDWF